jgi:hypothetical protein
MARMGDLLAAARVSVLNKMRGMVSQLQQMTYRPRELTQRYPAGTGSRYPKETSQDYYPSSQNFSRYPVGPMPKTYLPFLTRQEYSSIQKELNQAADALIQSPRNELNSAIDNAVRAANRAASDPSIPKERQEILHGVADALDEWKRIEDQSQGEEEEKDEDEGYTPGKDETGPFEQEEEPETQPGYQPRRRQDKRTKTGTLIVTFKYWDPSTGSVRPDAPGATYAYSNVTESKYNSFRTSSSAGDAVWDYLRVRGTISGHQHNYRLISASGEYIPRKATANGFKKRTLTGEYQEPSEDVIRTSESSNVYSFVWSSDNTSTFVNHPQRQVGESTLPPGKLTRFGKPIIGEWPMTPVAMRDIAKIRNAYAGRAAYPSFGGRQSYPKRGQPNLGLPNTGAP